jgi:cell division septal protein FtsQ
MKSKGEKEAPSARPKIIKSILMGVWLINGILILILGYLVFMRIPYFGLETVEIAGNQNLSKEEIIEVSEVSAGTNLLLIDLEEVSKKLTRHPRIARSSVYRRFPGKLLIEVKEREPAALLSAERLYYIDRNGHVFTRALPGDPVDYPLLTGVTAEQLTSRRDEVVEMARKGLSVLKIIQGPGFPKSIFEPLEISMDLNHGLSLLISGKKRIILGTDGYKEKLERLNRLRKFLESRRQWGQAKIIDLDYEDRALVRAGRNNHAANGPGASDKS